MESILQIRPHAAAIIFASLLLCPLVRPSLAADEQLSAQDKEIIDTLLDRLKDRKDMKFVREDKIYDAKTAAEYMRLKWTENKDKVRTVDDFVSLESVGGKHGEVTYYVQFTDGKRRPAREVLEESVTQIRGEMKGRK